MNKAALTLIRDENRESTDAAHLLLATKLDFLEVFPDDPSVKPYLSVIGFAQGFEGIGRIKDFVDSGIWQRLDVRMATREPDMSVVRDALRQIGEAEKIFDPAACPLNVAPLTKIIYVFDALLQKGRFQEVDEVLRESQVGNRLPSVLLAILTATLTAKDALDERRPFFRRVECEFVRTGRTDGRLLKGLD